MGNRLELHSILTQKLGSTYVYFQPPATLKINYPCIIYERSGIQSIHADDIRYAGKTRYMVTHIDRDADSIVPYKLLEIPYSSFDRYYSADNLHHNVFDIYY